MKDFITLIITSQQKDLIKDHMDASIVNAYDVWKAIMVQIEDLQNQGINTVSIIE
jgi:hypothetical protein